MLNVSSVHAYGYTNVVFDHLFYYRYFKKESRKKWLRNSTIRNKGKDNYPVTPFYLLHF
jgi:hypothetical protein